VVPGGPRVNDVAAPTQRLSHALGGPTAPSRHMFVASSVTTPLAKSSSHERGGNKFPSPQGAKGKEAMEIDGNDLGHLSYGLELEDIDADLPHSTIVWDDHHLALEDDRMQEDFSPVKKRPPRQRRPTPSQKDRRKTVVAKYAI